ncbi:unnamed protein product [Polarella glacialis]|uniref:Mitochondrial carrier protein n=1 Tax=Polarella glacialis TaxID=89957 RepID=A0A813DPR4_POLGL|nr:unnamed protein product [Polarella glacialis]|mmetsp:Transcript_60970/g.98717  ORF Transcript_60970/g.98717 Transcript_60970/m.98717 type:complete len:271 (-) Transcript_60970:86-898(-)|eukprot:CAMPEP_0115080510 /NCGR_PEP_ID=MMETSP0227-20121206/18719_1 /TAXON_ID=89957 /ORGANISM="Polarella glacialis, Strain CCMP 1383" /LENGTH=270 /DNA_ID=CAMNT_0002468163 /DNA_START=99 /DNA_END=911 /DNA_ORIENTATION=+
MSKNLSEAENAALGAIGGWADVTLLQATNYWKNAAQQGLPFETNPKVLYRGYLANVLNNASCLMMQFALTGYIQKLITLGEDRKLTATEKCGAAFTAGYTTGFVCGPIELAVIQQQRKGGSLVDISKNLLKGGPSVITRGTFGICLRESLYCACFLGLMPVIREKVKVQFPDSIGQSDDRARVAAAFIGGPICTIISHPPDTFKSCMQGDVERVKYGNMKETCAVIVKERGAAALWAGMPWRMVRQFCAVFIFDKVASDLGPVLFPHGFK